MLLRTGVVLVTVPLSLGGRLGSLRIMTICESDVDRDHQLRAPLLHRRPPSLVPRPDKRHSDLMVSGD